MITEYQYYQVLTERDEALAKAEELEELREEYYELNEKLLAKVEQLEAEIVTLRNIYRWRGCEPAT